MLLGCHNTPDCDESCFGDSFGSGDFSDSDDSYCFDGSCGYGENEHSLEKPRRLLEVPGS